MIGGSSYRMPFPLLDDTIDDVSVAAVARTAESKAVDALLTNAAARPCALVVAGEAGIGKTTLWNAAIEQARAAGFRVLAARAGEAESVLAYTAVADLLADVEDEVLDALPDLHRLAIDRVLLRADGEGPPTDQRVTGAALVSIVTALAQRTPVLLAIDDAQWLDSSSQPVLAYVARRLSGRVGMVLTERTPSEGAVAAPWLKMTAPDVAYRIRVGPMSLGALTAVIHHRLGRAVPRPTLVRIAEASGGNPFYALELARAVDGRSVAGDDVLPSTLAELMRLRTGHFGEAVSDMLLAAGCVADPTVDLLAEATGSSSQRVLELLAEPARDGIVTIDGDHVRFTHPLLARGVYTQAGPGRRRRMHRALAAVEAQPELKARHLALGTASADPDTLVALDTAARAAGVRGAAAAAAELCELAIGLGGDTPARRLRGAAEHFRSGDTDRSRRLVHPSLTTHPPGRVRAMACIIAGGSLIYDHDYAGAIELLSRAAEDAADLPLQRIQAELGLALAYTMTGRQQEAENHAGAAMARAEEFGSGPLISQALALHAHVACALGRGRDEEAVRRALDLEDLDADVPAPFRARAVDAITLAWAGRLEEARSAMLAVRRRCGEQGSDADMLWVSWHLITINVWLARYRDALMIATDAMERAEQLGSPHSIVMARTQLALVEAHLGRDGEARADLRRAVDEAARLGQPILAGLESTILGFLEVSRGDYAAALTALRPVLHYAAELEGTEIVTAEWIPNAVEAMVAVGRLDEAEPLVAALERNGARHDRAWMLAVGARCRAMVLAARGDLVAAEKAIGQAMDAHERLPMPFERARTGLFLGQLARRQRRKQVASRALTEAMTTFESLGATSWVERARTELTRVNVARGRDSALTPSEASVARLAVAGMSNRDIAAALFISPKTVEHNLSRVYRKLGVRARAELARYADAIAD